MPASVSPGRGRRAARLPGHNASAARIVRGLEGAIVDADRMTLAALEAGDPRELEVRVAGPAALLRANWRREHEPEAKLALAEVMIDAVMYANRLGPDWLI